MNITTEYIKSKKQIVYPLALMINSNLNQSSSDTSYFRKHKKSITIDCPSIDYKKFECTDNEW